MGGEGEIEGVRVRLRIPAVTNGPSHDKVEGDDAEGGLVPSERERRGLRVSVALVLPMGWGRKGSSQLRLKGIGGVL